MQNPSSKSENSSPTLVSPAFQDFIRIKSRDDSRRLRMNPCSTHAEGKNPLCGDEVEVFFQLSPEGNIENCTFASQSCAIVNASAATLCEIVRGLSRDAATALIQSVLQGITSPTSNLPETIAPLLEVKHLPRRIRCAELPWTAAQLALGKISAS